MPDQPPRRRFRMTLDLHADTRHDLTDKLYDLATDLMHHSAPMEQTSGGYATGHHYEIVENPDMDHDGYLAALDEWRTATSQTATLDELADLAFGPLRPE